VTKIGRMYRLIKSNTKKTNRYHIVNYEITSRCNLKCEHCYWRKTNNSTEELSDEEWIEIFLDHKSQGATNAYLTGGEPGLRLNVVKEANNIFNGISIVSNGTVRFPDEIQRRIFISIDGPKEIHNKIRNVNVFDKIMNNIQNDQRIILGATLTTTNYQYIDELIELTKEINVEGITFSTYTSHMEYGDPLLLEGEKLDWTINKLKEARKKDKKLVFLSPYMIELFHSKEHYKDCFF
jgi:MoaA/NifB/PqqE/SkfB family radical SAM enzyme